MKKFFKLTRTQNRCLLSTICAIALVTVIGFSFAACDNGTTITYDYSGKSIADFATWLKEQPDNTAETAYKVKLSVDDIGGKSSEAGSAGHTLRHNSTKYVSLDLSGCTFTLIYYEAFYSCDSLTSVNISKSVTVIGEGAFYDCTYLTSVNIPNSVTVIGLDAFHNCDSLTSVTIPNSVTFIDGRAFYRTSLTSVTIPNGVTSIGNYAFEYCKSLTSVTFAKGSNITNFGSYAFPEGTSGSGGSKLKTAYQTGGAGTYTREPNGSAWTKN